MATEGSKTIVLVTGANRGIGFEIVKALLKSSPSKSCESGGPYHVYLGARDTEKGKKAAASLIPEHNNSVSAIQIDTSSTESIASAVSSVKSDAGRIDVLINNAGIIYEEKDRITNLRTTLEVNVTATYAVSEAFRQLLLTRPAKGEKVKRIINVSSDLGSIAWRCDQSNKNYQVPNSEYRISKAALNMMTACQSYELKEHGVKVFAFNPGYTITELYGPVELRRQQGAWEADVPGKGCAKIVAGERDHEVGQMIEVDGVVPW
ncbi:putative NAD(P)-binding protein [Seiridium unicorne]|uniref:NAD(P)-binding protein n=1 Tax=Seiridium unicorne TaxID=138068 RepID=A0ABR2V358_9PEZI